jgi:hypothetical protein
VKLECVEFEVITAVTTNSSISWDVMPCGLVKVYRHVSEEHVARLSLAFFWFLICFDVALLLLKIVICSFVKLIHF